MQSKKPSVITDAAVRNYLLMQGSPITAVSIAVARAELEARLRLPKHTRKPLMIFGTGE